MRLMGGVPGCVGALLLRWLRVNTFRKKNAYRKEREKGREKGREKEAYDSEKPAHVEM